MTTATQSASRLGGVRVLLGAAAVSLLVGIACCIPAALMRGVEGLLGAGAGALLAIAVFLFGAVVVNAAAGVMPAASLLVALLTYGLQVIAMFVVCAALESGGALGHRLDPDWFAAGVIVVVLTWMSSQIALTMRARTPYYDLSEASAR